MRLPRLYPGGRRRRLRWWLTFYSLGKEEEGESPCPGRPLPPARLASRAIEEADSVGVAGGAGSDARKKRRTGGQCGWPLGWPRRRQARSLLGAQPDLWEGAGSLSQLRKTVCQKEGRDLGRRPPNLCHVVNRLRRAGASSLQLPTPAFPPRLPGHGLPTARPPLPK